MDPPAVAQVPVEPPQVPIETLILDIIRKHDYPLSATYIAAELKLEKTVVNRILYTLNSKKTIEVLKMIPPLWRIVK